MSELASIKRMDRFRGRALARVSVLLAGQAPALVRDVLDEIRALAESERLAGQVIAFERAERKLRELEGAR